METQKQSNMNKGFCFLKFRFYEICDISSNNNQKMSILLSPNDHKKFVTLRYTTCLRVKTDEVLTSRTSDGILWDVILK